MKGVHWIDLGQWPLSLAVIGDADAYKRFVKAYCSDSEQSFPRLNAGRCQYMEDPKGNKMLVIAVGRQSSRAEMMLTLAHEATHAMRWILQYIGEKEPGTETEAYLVEHITRRSFAALKKG